MMKVRRIMASGALVDLLTLCKDFEKGKALSLAMAKPILEVTVMLLKPAQNTLTSKREDMVTEPILLCIPSLLVKA